MLIIKFNKSLTNRDLIFYRGTVRYLWTRQSVYLSIQPVEIVEATNRT